MPKFGKRSLDRLNTVHPYLQLICHELIKIYDVTILEGHRDQEKQDNYFNAGKSKLKYPQSKHNSNPSLAVDLAPWHFKKPHIRWDDLKSFYYMIGLIKGIAHKLNIPIRSGSDWDRDGDLNDNHFNDLPHIELDIK